LLERLINFLEQNIEDPALTVDTISKEIGLSRVHLFRKMKAIAGMTPSAFIKDFRMKKAKAIFLKNPSASVAEVAYSVGFQDVKYFSKCFKKHFGQSPKNLSDQNSQKPEMSS
jgi:AraC-like DNA-binding protein